MTTDAPTIQELLRTYVAAEIVCAPVNGSADGRVECLTPLEYPSGDAVAVWIEGYDDRYVVTDYGESLTGVLSHPPQDHKALVDQVLAICGPLGLAYDKGSVRTEAAFDEIGDAVWRIATAASLIAQSSVAFHPRRRQQPVESPFVVAVEHVLRDRSVTVERERKVTGASGHRHTATIYLPQREAILEPIQGHWNQVSSVYAKFGDLSRSNGYRLLSLLDDRSGEVDEELARMLVQVSDVVQWTRRDEWLGNVS
jgi:hypothetical protein